MAAAVRLYLDENITPKVAVQLRRRGVDSISVHELGLTGDTDVNHLKRATEMQRALVTADTDFLIMASQGVQHAGIIFGIQEQLAIGDWVNRLEMIAAVYSAEDMINHVEYL